MNDIKAPEFIIYFRSDKSLEEVAEVLSQKVMGGAPFGGKEDTIRDEFPAVYIEREILGSFFTLMGGPGDETYEFEMSPAVPDDPSITVESFVDISGYVMWLLQDVKEFEFLDKP